MMRRTLAALLLLWLPAHAAAPDAQTQAFVRALVEAINSKDAAKRKALIHPDSLRCANERDALLDEHFARQAGRTIPLNVSWTLTPAHPGQPLFADKFDYPVRPTHLLQLDFETGPNRSTTIVLQLAKQGNEWREVSACPKPETVAAAKLAAQARAQHREKVEHLLKNILPQVKGEVVALLKDGRKIEAIRHYRAASGEDLSTAKAVVDAIQEELPR
jgi:ribosomal protein L7/L12